MLTERMQIIPSLEGVFFAHWCCVSLGSALHLNELYLIRHMEWHSGVGCVPRRAKHELWGGSWCICFSRSILFFFFGVCVWLPMLFVWLYLGVLCDHFGDSLGFFFFRWGFFGVSLGVTMLLARAVLSFLGSGCGFDYVGVFGLRLWVFLCNFVYFDLGHLS